MPKLALMESLKGRARQLKAETYALYWAYRDPRVPWYAKVWVAIVVGYAFSPIDLVPDFIPILGYLDDLVLVPLGMSLALKMIPVEVLEECREKSRELLADGQPRSWVTTAVIISIWILVLAMIATIVIRFTKR